MRNGAKQSPFAGADSQPFAQLNLVHEDVYDAARALVAALGGAKRVGPLLFPQKPADGACRYLLDCLNPNREQDLGLERWLLLLRLGRERGVHIGMYWMCDDVGYARPPTVDPGDERAELQRQFLAGVEQLEQLARRLQR